MGYRSGVVEAVVLDLETRPPQPPDGAAVVPFHHSLSICNNAWGAPRYGLMASVLYQYCTILEPDAGAAAVNTSMLQGDRRTGAVAGSQHTHGMGVFKLS